MIPISQLKDKRKKLINLLADPSSNPEDVDVLFTDYLSLIIGFTFGPDELHSDRSKLRHSIRFKWTHTLLGSQPIVMQDSLYEVISMSQEYALWLTKYASYVCSKGEYNQEDAKKAHTALRKAAGIFEEMDIVYAGQLLDQPGRKPNSELDSKVCSAYQLQWISEAQEITIFRAIELNHSKSLISSIAYETSRSFLAAADIVKSLDSPKWLKYLMFKSLFYETHAWTHHAENLLSLDKCGDALRVMQEAKKVLDSTLLASKEYEKLKGKGVKLRENIFFRRLQPLVDRIQEKCQRENMLLFHHKISDDLVPLEGRPSHGLAVKIKFDVPPVNPLWTLDAYNSFKLVPFEPNKPQPNSPTDAEPVAPVQEKEPLTKTDNGCSIQ